ncbi:MAG: hypothetical protein NXI22_11495 [bacterium]|nr:hypothetical protein [bacterium]
MNNSRNKLLAERNLSEQERIDKLVDFWQPLMNGTSSGSTTWKVLEYFDMRVSRCLADSPPDVDLAESLTANAIWHLTGRLKS